MMRNLGRIKKAISRRSWRTFGAVILLVSLASARNATAGLAQEQVCDVGADYALGVEDYSEAIRLHAEVVRRHPDNALAHYHLGFAEGMVGNRTAEIGQYQQAASLGLRAWDLFLNLGLAQFENGDLDQARSSLHQAVLLGENHPESHYNLALVDERSGMLQDAEHEVLTSLRLNPWQPDARNLLGVIYAERGETVRALQVWQELLRADPDYQPARTNLALLGNRNPTSVGETPSVVKAVADGPKLEVDPEIQTTG